MPLPPLPANNTDRYFFDYVSGNHSGAREHTVTWRYSGSSGAEALMQTRFLDFLNALGASAFHDGWRLVRIRKQLEGQIFSVPVAIDAPLAAFVGAGSALAVAPRDEAVEDTFQGRSLSSGRRVSFSLYRCMGPADSTLRYGMPGAVQTALSSASGASCLLAIDNSQPSWYTYINQNYNSYWERELRS